MDIKLFSMKKLEDSWQNAHSPTVVKLMMTNIPKASLPPSASHSKVERNSNQVSSCSLQAIAEIPQQTSKISLTIKTIFWVDSLCQKPILNKNSTFSTQSKKHQIKTSNICTQAKSMSESTQLMKPNSPNDLYVHRMFIYDKYKNPIF